VFTLFDKRPAGELSSYPIPGYQRHGPALFGAARQVPVAQADSIRAARRGPRDEQ
jgi:hypothetical protein